jgi:cell division protein FtsQ
MAAIKNRSESSMPPERLQTENGSYLRKRGSRSIRKSKKLSSRWKTIFLLTAYLTVTVAVGLVAIQFYQYVTYSNHFQLRQVVFSGVRYANADRWRSEIVKKFSGNLLQLSLGDLRRNLETDHWIAQARVRRILPDTLKIDLVEREPMALAGVDNGIFVVSRDGTLLDRYSNRYGSFPYPLIRGLAAEPGGRETNYRRMLLFLSAMEKLDSTGAQLTKTISEVDVSDLRNLVVIPTNETVKIYLGEEDFLPRYQSHLKRINAFHQLKEKVGPLEAVDLRFKGQVVYQRAKNEIPAGNVTSNLPALRDKQE